MTEGLVTEDMFYSLPVREENDGPKITLLFSDTVIYAIELCRLNVWKWQDTGWINLYQYSNKGLCISDVYLQDGKILGFTSSGFWTANSNIYTFDEQAGSWELYRVKNSVIEFMSAVNFRLGNDTLISLMNITYDRGETTMLNTESSFGIDLKTNKWFEVKISYDLQVFNKFSPHFTVDFEHTFHAYSSAFHLIVDKKKREVFYEKLNSFNPRPDFYFTNYSKVFIQQEDKEMEFIDAVPKEAVLVGTLTYNAFSDIPKNTKSQSNVADSSFVRITLILFVLVIGIVFGLYFNFFKRKINKWRKASSSILKKVMAYSGENFKSDELDELFKINYDLNYDSRRVRRSRIIRDLNMEYQKLEGKDIITRQKDPKDKRYVIFRIEK
ncbi:hypothetical protein N9544_06515 [Flavobacteriales bacterium]|nr:hypothetical protein [Flavobacteriales bacterium]